MPGSWGAGKAVTTFSVFARMDHNLAGKKCIINKPEKPFRLLTEHCVECKAE